MADTERSLDRFYFGVVVTLMFAGPTVSLVVEHALRGGDWLQLTGKWFAFWGVGMRLFTAGVRQVAKPAFTAQTIFHATSTESFAIVRELGYANVCIGLLGLVSVGVPSWRVPAAIVGGLFFANAGLIHVIRKPAGPNEAVAMVSDLFVAAVLAAWLALRAF